MTTFFDTGRVDDSHFHHQGLDFKVTLGFPRLAKLTGLAVLALGVVALIALALLARGLA